MMTQNPNFSRLNFIGQTVRLNLGAIIAVALIGTLLYYLILMAALVVRFDNLPNYINSYDWWFHIKRIWVSTPSVLDTISIVQDEWLYEIGFMNYDFGIGISEWSLFINPTKVSAVFILGVSVAINFFLIRANNRVCSLTTGRTSQVATGFGASLVALGSITMSWVVCCSTPTWVVGLAMMGLGVSVSLWLEPIGIWVNVIGFAMLLFAIYLSASRARTLANSIELPN